MLLSFRFLSVLIFTLVCFRTYGQYQGMMYADVRLKDGSIVSGPVRWSGGQMLWSDVLLVEKTQQYALKYLNRSEVNALSDNGGLDWQFMNLWKEKLPQRGNEIVCRFGDIASLHITGPDQAQIYFKNGYKLRVKADEHESRHLGKTITVFDGGKRKLVWENISRISFRSAPDDFKPFQGTLLYGRILTTSGEISGYIQWDKIKFLSSQTLEGKLDDNSKTDNEYKFETIESVEKRDQGAVVKFNDDKKLFLKNNRDVNAFNRGIVVMHPVWGRAIVEWEAFKAAYFAAVPEAGGYSDYSSSRRIYGTVKTTEGKIFKGNCTFDLDEEWSNELLEGSGNGVHYQIPFKQVKSISPLGANLSKVTLVDGRVLNLSGHNDVTSKNWGLVIHQSNAQREYISWDKVANISLR